MDDLLRNSGVRKKTVYPLWGLLQASNLMVLSTITATIVHELKQPLFGIKYFAQFMLKESR